MKNKKLTYALLPLVVLVWGMIIYRIMNVSGPDLPADNKIVYQEKMPATAGDSFSISANYRDPFNAPVVRYLNAHPGNLPNPVPVVQKKAAQPASNSWPKVAYNGTIRNQQSKKELAMVEIDGQNNFMKQGDRLREIQLLKISRDSILVCFGKEKKVIYK
ncbi:MAG: hypothetical protein ACJ77K_06805 [Bacteroidia bacterium]